MFVQSCNLMNNWRWDNLHSLADKVNRSIQQTTSLGKVKPTSERFSRFSSDDPRAKISWQAASSTSQATSWAIDHWSGIRYSTRMMMMRPGRMPERRAFEIAVPAMTMTMTMVRTRRTCTGVSKRLGKGREHRMGSGKGRQLRTERGKGRARGAGTGMWKISFNKPHGEMISLVLLLRRCRRKLMRQTRTRRAN